MQKFSKVDTKEISLDVLKDSEKSILAFSSFILDQMEENNQFLYSVIDRLLSDDLVFNVVVDVPTNVAVVTIKLKEVIGDTQKTFTKEYDETFLGLPTIPPSIKLNKVLIDTIKDLLNQLGI